MKPETSNPRSCSTAAVPLILVSPPRTKEVRARRDRNAFSSGPPFETSTPIPTMTGMSTQAQDPDRPAAAVVREARAPDNPEEDREALELQEIQTHEDNELDWSTPSASSGEEYQPTQRTTSRRSVRRTRVHRTGWWSQIARFWTHHVTLTVPQKSNRDHFALERTFLAYIRTSVVIAMQGVLIAQLFRLQKASSSVDRLRFYQVGIPLSVACHCVAVLVATIGAYRFWRQQGAISKGKVHAGGWELNWVGILLFAIILVTLIISVAIIVEIETTPATMIQRILSL